MTVRAPLRDELYQILLERILNSTLAPGSRVNESRLAQELNVSRTPLREALLRLEQEGFVYADQLRGFIIQPLTEREVREVYPILGNLEGLALRLSGTMTTIDFVRLEQLNQELSEAHSDPVHAHQADAAFHNTLHEWCPNRRLLDMIAEQWRAIRRYESLYMREARLIEISVQQHASILTALQAGSLDQAVAGLEENFLFSMHSLLIQLQHLA
ncbi:GntR family transcriptional regulator [Ktedonosporobacter rubrisoli]|uniref:GntR family transcriptional regulator n=1 Tax=Ktedonosporobacter rubrisoli TaxID=2509675 RepID=A0A4P6JR22_KTERU|nr:GntR family transcriptional regulator [Ktedonosporobacter rubrisoli]QBD77640.1 GntR family transcriptional regulator [Ktedonosporobacter rubrisoli]